MVHDLARYLFPASLVWSLDKVGTDVEERSLIPQSGYAVAAGARGRSSASAAADDRRDGVVDPADADRHSGDLCSGERDCDPIDTVGAIPAANVIGRSRH